MDHVPFPEDRRGKARADGELPVLLVSSAAVRRRAESLWLHAAVGSTLNQRADLHHRD